MTTHQAPSKATLTIAEAAAHLKKSARTVRRWIDLGLIVPVAIRGGGRRLCAAAVARIADVLETVRRAMTYQEAARVLGIGVEGVRKMVQRGRLKVVKGPDGSVGVDRADFARLVEAGAFQEDAAAALAAHARG